MRTVGAWLLLASLPHSASAQGGWLEVAMGGGRIDSATAGNSRPFGLDFSGGIWVGGPVGIGVRLGGWTVETFDVWDPSEGESYSETFAVLRLRPWEGLRIQAEYGWTEHEHPDPFEPPPEGSGPGWRLAAGWEFRFGEGFTVSPLLVLGGGRIDTGPSTYRIATSGLLLGFGWSW